MLHLAAPTPPDWGDYVLANLGEVLLDHAHCEKKAASTAINLIFRYPDQPALMLPLSRLAREELAHFELVIDHLRRRGLDFERQRPSTYASRLVEIVRKDEPNRLLDMLLCCAMIEARSCERMQHVAAALESARNEPELAQLYRGLLASEARHHAGYVDLARGLGLAETAEFEARLREVAEHEAEVIATAPVEPRLHSAGPQAPNKTTA